MITVVPSQIAHAPRQIPAEKCDMQVVIGEDTCEKPMVLKVPLCGLPCLLSALQGSQNGAAIGAAMTGMATFNTGEGGLVPEEARFARATPTGK